MTLERSVREEDDPFASFHGWTSEEDERLFSDL